MKYELSGRADSDLKEIYKYSYVTHGKAQADRYYDGLIARLEFLAGTPLIARARREQTPAAPESYYALTPPMRKGRARCVKPCRRRVSVR